MKSLINTDADRIRKAVMHRFSALDGIGKDLTQCRSYDEALEKSQLGFEPQVKKMQTLTNVPIDGYKAIFNGNNDKLLSVVKEEYTVVSNSEAFSIAEDLQKELGFNYVVSNVVKDGARCRLILAGPDVNIANETYRPYVVLNNSFDLSRSISVQFMFERLVCLNSALRKAPHIPSSIALTHFGEKSSKLQRLTQFKVNFEKVLTYLQAEAVAFQNTPLSRDEFRTEILPQLINHVFQRDAKTQLTDRQLTRTQSFIDACLSAYDAQDTENFNGTAYKVYLTMTDLDSHMNPFVNRGNSDVYINRVLQTDTIMSMANFVGNYLLKSRHIKV